MSITSKIDIVNILEKGLVFLTLCNNFSSDFDIVKYGMLEQKFELYKCVRFYTQVNVILPAESASNFKDRNFLIFSYHGWIGVQGFLLTLIFQQFY